MRVIAVAATVALILAGCASEPRAAPSADKVSIAPTASDPIPLVAATVDWHGSDPSPELHLADLVTQPIASPCIWENPQGHREVYFNNLLLNGVVPMEPVPNGTTALDITLSWTVQDSLLERLVMAYEDQAGALHESPFLPNGETVRVDVPDANTTSIWAFWVCVNRDDASGLTSLSEGRLSSFYGAIDISVAAVQDADHRDRT